MYRENGETEHSVLVIGLNGRVMGMHVTTGKILWEHRIGGRDVELIIRDDGRSRATCTCRRSSSTAISP